MVNYYFVKESRTLFGDLFSSDYNHPKLYVPDRLVLGHFSERGLSSRPIGESGLVLPLLFDDSEKILSECEKLLDSEDLLVVESGTISEKDLGVLVSVVKEYQAAEKKAVEQTVKTINLTRSQ